MLSSDSMRSRAREVRCAARQASIRPRQRAFAWGRPSDRRSAALIGEVLVGPARADGGFWALLDELRTSAMSAEAAQKKGGANLTVYPLHQRL
jgi:hypothetical protein